MAIVSRAYIPARTAFGSCNELACIGARTGAVTVTSMLASILGEARTVPSSTRVYADAAAHKATIATRTKFLSSALMASSTSFNQVST